MGNRLDHWIWAPLMVIILILIKPNESVKCYDCVGMDCMGSFCHGDYCMVSQYAPRWGSVRWDEPKIVKGCVKGSMVSKDVRDHCEWAEGSSEPFTCFCKSKDLCNGRRMTMRAPRENVDLVQCVCNGDHCRNDKTCFGELCTYVKNHKTKQVEQGCTNASVPLIERRAIGSCMAPPITGAMHHNVAKDAHSLKYVESCICGSDYCNSEKPQPEGPETQKCKAYVATTIMGTKTQSRNSSCEGEFCFKATISSKIGVMSHYQTEGCASFTGEDPLPEELDADGCATFSSENLEVKTCFKTSDRDAIGRARASKQVPEYGRKGTTKTQKPMEIEYDDDYDEDEAREQDEEEEEKTEDVTPARREKGRKKEEAKESKKLRKKPEKVLEQEEEVVELREPPSTTPKTFIFEKPTQPPIPDDSNTTMITVFVLLILCILGSGIVIKFELHKKLKRSSYDTVAGG